MTIEGTPVSEIGDFSDGDGPPALLILTDAERRGRIALAMPFHDATVIEVDGTERIDIDNSFDTIVIDRSSDDPRWLDVVGSSATKVLRPTGRLIITLDVEHHVARVTDPAALVGLRWQGFGLLGGRPCAVLGTGDATEAGAVTAGMLLATAETAVRLAARQLVGGDSGLVPDYPRVAMAKQIDDRWRSEEALLLRLEALARELDQERRRHQGTELVRTVLRRSKLAGPARRILRPSRRVARKLRSTKLAESIKRTLARGRRS